ncbi:MAG: hypothetical protein U5J64_06665 [Halobacteriales archaeon]|nr:hypothetical protein [Halobacteriales archaeon]
MVSETVLGAVLGAVIGVLGTVVGYVVAGWFNLKSTKIQREAENKRLLAELPLQKKTDDLSEVHSRLTRCQEELGRILSYGEWGNELDVTEEEFNEELMPMVKEYSQSMANSKIHLSPEQQVVLENAEGEILKTMSLIKTNSPELNYEPNVDALGPEKASWEGLQVACTKAQGVLREEFKKPIEQIESE